MNKELTIVINTCDLFSDIWNVTIFLLKNYWKQCEYAVVLLTDTNKNNYSFDGVEILCAGEKKEITERLLYAIPFIKTKYVLMTLDDYFINDNISSEKIVRILDYCTQNSIDYCRFFLRPKPYKNEKIKNQRKMWTIDNSRIYSVNLYPGLWTLDFLKFTLKGKIKNAWQYEVFLTKAATNYKLNAIVSLNNEFPFIDGIRKGLFLRRSKKFIDRLNIYQGNRGVCSRWFEFKLNARTTH